MARTATTRWPPSPSSSDPTAPSRSPAPSTWRQRGHSACPRMPPSRTRPRQRRPRRRLDLRRSRPWASLPNRPTERAPAVGPAGCSSRQRPLSRSPPLLLPPLVADGTSSSNAPLGVGRAFTLRHHRVEASPRCDERKRSTTWRHRRARDTTSSSQNPDDPTHRRGLALTGLPARLRLPGRRTVGGPSAAIAWHKSPGLLTTQVRSCDHCGVRRTFRRSAVHAPRGDVRWLRSTEGARAGRTAQARPRTLRLRGQHPAALQTSYGQIVTMGHNKPIGASSLASGSTRRSESLANHGRSALGDLRHRHQPTPLAPRQS